MGEVARMAQLLQDVVEAATELRDGDGVEAFPRSGLWRAIDALEAEILETKRTADAAPRIVSTKYQRHDGSPSRPRVFCDEHCGAFAEPNLDDVTELRAALVHWESHGCLGGCSHGS